MSIDVRLETPNQPEILEILKLSDAYMAELYPPTSNHLVDINTLLQSNVSFLVARLNNNIVGCASLVRSDDGMAEIKRMFITDDGRGHGIGNLLLQTLIECGHSYNLEAIRLETGISQPEAIGLYRKFGFEEIAAFPPYEPDILSLFMEKRLIK